MLAVRAEAARRRVAAYRRPGASRRQRGGLSRPQLGSVPVGRRFRLDMGHDSFPTTREPLVAGLLAHDRPSPVALPVAGALRLASRRARRNFPARCGARRARTAYSVAPRTAPCPPRCDSCWTVTYSDVPAARRDQRDTRWRHGARRVPLAVLRPPGSAQRGEPEPVDGALRDQRHRHSDWVNQRRAISTSPALVYSSSSMAERVSSLLRRSVEHLADEVPDSYRLLLDELGPMVVELDVDGEVFSLRGGHRLEVSDGAADTAGCPDRHLASRDPRRARRQGRAG